MEGPLFPDQPVTYFRPKALPFKRRESDRVRSKHKVIGQLLLPDTGELVAAWILDLSEKGMACRISTKLEPDTRAVIKLKKNKAVSKGVTIPMRVVHATAESDGWIVGFEFNEALNSVLLEYLTC